MIKKNWHAADIPDLSGKTAVVTGANSGIGFETAKALAARSARVIMACRNPEKAGAAADAIRADLPGADLRILSLDLSHQVSVNGFAERILSDYTALDLLINNAGIMIPPYGRTPDGFELQMGTNHLGHFALTGRLLPLLNATPSSRIVSVSSAAHNFGNIDFTDIHWEDRPYKPWRAYGDSKIANLYFTFSLADRLAGQGSRVVCAAAHPGWASTELQRHTGMIRFLNRFFSQSPAKGALPTLYAACGPDVTPKSYYGPGGRYEMKGYPRPVRPHPRAMDQDVAERLWRKSEALTGVTFELK